MYVVVNPVSWPRSPTSLRTNARAAGSLCPARNDGHLLGENQCRDSAARPDSLLLLCQGCYPLCGLVSGYLPGGVPQTACHTGSYTQPVYETASTSLSRSGQIPSPITVKRSGSNGLDFPCILDCKCSNTVIPAPWFSAGVRSRCF